MSITRVGSSEKYASGWELAFGKTKKSTASSPLTKKKKVAVKSSKASAKSTSPKGKAKSKRKPASAR